jgi:hypothetical protein
VNSRLRVPNRLRAAPAGVSIEGRAGRDLGGAPLTIFVNLNKNFLKINLDFSRKIGDN